MDVGNGCYDVSIISVNFNIPILNIHDVDYCSIINRISASEAANLIQTANKVDKYQIVLIVMYRRWVKKS